VTRTLAAALLLVLFGISGGGQPSETAGGAVRRLNRQILTLVKTPARSAAAHAALREMLSERATQWKRLAASDPQAALDAVLPAEARAALGAESALVEAAGEWSGEFERWVADDFDNRRQADLSGMRISGRTIQLYFAPGQTPPAGCGGVIRVKGAMLDDTAAVREAVWERASGACPRTGEQRVAAILVNVTDAQLPANVTNASVRSLLFGGGSTLDSYWREASYGKTSATGDVFGPFHLNMTYQCDGNNILNSMQPLLDAAIAAADAQVDFRQYSRLLLIVPREKFCNLGGFATLGCSSLTSSDGTSQASRAFVRADAADLPTIAHEMGHTLGLGHSGALYYSGEPVGPLGSLVTPEEYGNPWDVMGGGNCAGAGLTGHYVSRHKYGLGWLADSNLQTTEASGVYTIQPIETASSGVQALRVRRGLGNDHYVWIEYRRPVGFDASMQNCSFTPFDGVLLFYEQPAYSGDNRTRLLDFGNSPAIAGNTGRRAYAAALKAGQRWTDPYTQLSIEVLSAGASASVRINYDTPCSVISPASASFQPPPQQGSISVNAPGSCNVAAVSNDPSWITITGGGGFTGSGTVSYSISSNMLPQRRSSSISVGRQTFPIVQNADNGQPAPVSVSPSSGSSAGGVAQRFQFRFTDPDGGTHLTETSVLFNSLHSLVGGCYFTYFPQTRVLRLYGDDGGSWNSWTISAPQTLSNGQCSLNVGTTTATVSGVNVDLAVTITFDASFAGAKQVFMSAKDSWSADSGRILMGSWTVGAASCSVSGSAPVTNFGSGGGSSSFQISANLPSCPWSITGAPSWITVNQTSGSGGALVGFAVAANTGAARSATLNVAGTSITITQTAAGCTVSGSASVTGFGPDGGNGTFQISANLTTCAWSITGVPSWITVSQTSGSGAASAGFAVGANSGAARSATLNVAGTSITITQTAASVSGLRYVPVTPCRVADTRQGSGGATLTAGSSRTIQMANSGCGLPATAKAYAVNVTVVPRGPLGFLTVWPTGSSRPLASTLNSFEGAVVANSAIVPAGTGGAIDVFATGATDVILDANGYFTDQQTASNLVFYPVAPCRVMDTRAGQGTSGSFGPPQPGANSTRAVPVAGSACGIPTRAQAYSVNFTVVPARPLGFLAAYPSGQSRPLVSTLNSFEARVVANGAIVPAGAGGSIDVFVTDPTDVIMDINGYFAPDDGNGLYFHAFTPCRAVDTRAGQGTSGAFGPPIMNAGSSRSFPFAGVCGVPQSAQAYSMNVTVAPSGLLGFLTAWPTGAAQPLVSTLNSFDGRVVANGALVPAGSAGAVSLFVTDPTHVIVDLNGYFSR
jgi:M6 family metalloprotease-like protein